MKKEIVIGYLQKKYGNVHLFHLTQWGQKHIQMCEGIGMHLEKLLKAINIYMIRAHSWEAAQTTRIIYEYHTKTPHN